MDNPMDVLQLQKTRTDRLLARTAVILLSVVLAGVLYVIGRPVWWHAEATVLRPFEHDDMNLDGDDPFSSAVLAAESREPAGVLSGANGREVEPRIEQPKVEVKPQQEVTPAAFDIDAYPLTRERVMGYLQQGYIMVTWANHHYIDFARSWVYHVKKAGITGYMVGAMDDEMLRALVDMRINTWRMNSGITKGDLGWGSDNFHKMGRAKISLIKAFMQFGVNVVISDIDTAWMKNPLPYFDRYPKADILTSTDNLKETVKDDSLELFPQAGAAFNIGIMLFRPNSSATVDKWIKTLELPNVWDQNAFNDLIRIMPSAQDDQHLFKGDMGSVTVGVLPASIFASGHMFFVQRKYAELGLEPYVAHATFQYSGTPGKRERFREVLLFDDPPEYFDHEKGFIALNVELPPALMAKVDGSGVKGPLSVDKVVNHFELVHYQLLKLRTALALATVTGRAVIMPPIWCELDKYWGPLMDGNIPGSQFKKPFICPLDHILDLEGHWARVLPEDAFGPHIEWREYSFLQNPRMTAAVNNSRLAIGACSADNAGGCAGGVQVTGVQPSARMGVSKGASMEALKAALNAPEAATFKILVLEASALDALHSLWKTLPQPDLSRFENRLKHYPACMCCLREHPPGWIWYDFLMDEPHTDRFGRTYNGTWKWHVGDQQEMAKWP